MSSLRPPPGTVLQGALCGCARQAVLDLQRLETWPGQAIHRLRVRMKKLRALLELLHGHLPPACLRPLKSHARTLRQAFTQDRDEEVLATLEAGLLGRPPAPSPAAVTLSPALRRKARRLASTAGALCDGLAALDLGTLTWGQVEAAHLRHHACGCRQRRECEDDPSPDHLHRLRKTTKTLYYQTLLLGRRRKHARRRLAQARRLGSILGRLHDVDQLLAGPRCSRPGLLRRAADKRRRQLEHHALHLARRLFKG